MVAATAAQDQFRFTVLGLALGVRLQVLSESGEPVYDSGFRRGSVVQWPVRDPQAPLPRDGVYGCFVTVDGLDGSVTRRRGIVQVVGGRPLIHDPAAEPATAGDEAGEQFTVLPADDPAPLTLLSHDGSRGWVESTSGSLSFFAGGGSRGRDSIPQLTLTPEGRLGVGVAEPEARLDVAGTIRASEGFQFSDGDAVLKIEGGYRCW